MRYFSLLTLLLLSPLFALVSIAPVDIGSKPGISGNVSGSFSSKSGNTEKDEYSLGLRLQYDEGNDYLFWGTATYDYGKSQDTKNEDKTYAHFRYIREMQTEDWCGEAFVQTQQDEFKDINDRSLVGGGVRWRFFNTEAWGKGYAGLGAFYEAIEYAHPLLNPDEDNERINSYIAYTKSFMTASKLSYVGYYQPKFSDGSDYVTSQKLELIVPIYGKLNLSMSAAYDYDSRPPVGIKKSDKVFNTALLWEF